MSDRERHIPHERAVTAAAAAILRVDPTAIERLSEARIHPGPILDYDTRDFGLDGLEEGADWRFYLACDIRRLDETLSLDRDARAARRLMLEALADVISAFEKHRQARDLINRNLTRRAA